MFFYTPTPVALGSNDIPLPQDIVDLLTVDTVNQAFTQLADAIAYNEDRINDSVVSYTFTSSTVVNLASALSGAMFVHLLMIGGGGAGGGVSPVAGRGGAGAGGAGGIIDLWFPGLYFPTTDLTITIGAGGVAGGSINGDNTVLTATGLSLTAELGLGGTTATSADGQFGGDGGFAYTSPIATQGQGGAGGSGAVGVTGGGSNFLREHPGGGGGGGGGNGFSGGNGASNFLGFLGGVGGSNGNPGAAGPGYGAGGGGQGRADGGGGGGGGAGIGNVAIAPNPATNSAGGDGMSGLVRIIIVK